MRAEEGSSSGRRELEGMGERTKSQVIRERVQEGARQEACRAWGMLPSVRLPWTFEEGCARD